MRLVRLSCATFVLAVNVSSCSNSSPIDSMPDGGLPVGTTTTEPPSPPVPNPEEAGRRDAGIALTPEEDASDPARGRDAAPPPEPPPPPRVESPDVIEGPWGTVVTLRGEGLGSASRSNVFLIVGDDQELVLTPADSDIVSSWTESEVVFRAPFPVSGALAIETPQGSADAGRFEPTWTSTAYPMAAAASLLSSLSPAAGQLAILVDDETLLEYAAGKIETTRFDLTGAAVDPSTVRLYATDDAVVHGFALSKQAPRVLLDFTPSDSGYAAEVTELALEGEDFAAAGGPEGAAIWMHQTAGWRRARPTPAGWAFDAGPVEDPNPTGKKHASGATSDGALYIGWAMDSGNFFDDMERPVVRRLGPNATAFEASVPAGRSMDDYLTSLALQGRGPGLIVHYCGSDSDPWGLSSTGYQCSTSARTTDGAELIRGLNEGAGARYAMTRRAISVAYCDDDDNLRIASDLESDPGEMVLWPCSDIVTLELDSEREPLVVTRNESGWHFLERRTRGE